LSFCFEPIFSAPPRKARPLSQMHQTTDTTRCTSHQYRLLSSIHIPVSSEIYDLQNRRLQAMCAMHRVIFQVGYRTASNQPRLDW